MNYEPLTIEITQNGRHQYRQKWCNDHAAVYEQRNPSEPLFLTRPSPRRALLLNITQTKG